MTDHAAEASKYQILATQAASALSDAWIQQMQELLSTTHALRTCTAAPQGLRDLATRLINTLEVTTGAAASITQRAKVSQQVFLSRGEGKSAIPPAVARLVNNQK